MRRNGWITAVKSPFGPRSGYVLTITDVGRAILANCIVTGPKVLGSIAAFGKAVMK